MQVLLVFAGRSVEHEVSIRSAANVYKLLKDSGYTVLCVGINFDGQWYAVQADSFFAQIQGHHVPKLGADTGVAVWLRHEAGQVRLVHKDNSVVFVPEIVFPITHGTYGEDGSLQGLFQQMDIPFVGCDVFASACAMDKDFTKRLLRDAGIAVTPWVTIYERERMKYNYTSLAKTLGPKLFIKPARGGSSVGAGLATNAQEYEKMLDEAFQFDNKVIVEQCIKGREIEFAILGSENVVVSVPGEIKPATECYSYEEKYVLNTTQLIVPAPMDENLMKEGQRLAAKAYQTIGCEGMARVDFFLQNGTWFVSEINTLPGFTSISMYPKLCAQSGILEKQLVQELLQLGLQRFAKQRKLQTQHAT